MPRFPGENNGGKAHFLADGCGPVLGVDPKTGLVCPDDPKVGKNPTKANHHFWTRIQEAAAALPDSADLSVLLRFRDRYLKTANDRGNLPFAGERPFGKEEKTHLLRDLERCVDPARRADDLVSGGGITHFRAKFAAARLLDRRLSSANLIRGGRDEHGTLPRHRPARPAIAGSHKPEIKGVPNLPPKGGYLVSFARESPAFASYGFEGSTNAPVSEAAVRPTRWRSTPCWPTATCRGGWGVIWFSARGSATTQRVGSDVQPA